MLDLIPSIGSSLLIENINLFRNLKKSTIPDSVELIETFAINNLSNLQEIDLGNVKIIEEYAFWNCNGVINCNADAKHYIWDKNWNVFNMA